MEPVSHAAKILAGRVLDPSLPPPVQVEGVVAVTGHDVKVEVEDRLFGLLPAREE